MGTRRDRPLPKVDASVTEHRAITNGTHYRVQSRTRRWRFSPLRVFGEWTEWKSVYSRNEGGYDLSELKARTFLRELRDNETIRRSGWRETAFDPLVDALKELES